MDSLKDFSAREGFPLIIKEEYGLRDFLKAVAEDIDQRCVFCYTSRLEETARQAVKLGCDAFSTTLLYSKYQKHELIREIADDTADRLGIRFFYRDWRPLWDEGVRLSKEGELYRQKYCGCIFSEEERYIKGKK